MDVRYVNPFVESTFNVFQKMLSTAIKRGVPRFTRDDPKGDELIAIIGLGGQIRGAVVLQLPVSTGLGMAGRILMAEKTEVDADVFDAVAEITNMIAGGAKAQLSEIEGEGNPITLGLPTVLHGTNSGLGTPAGSLCLEVPFESDLGNFVVRVSLEAKK